MNFDDLVKQVLALEADNRHLGKPRGFPRHSSMPDANVIPDEETFLKGSYIKPQSKGELADAGAVGGSLRDPEQVADTRKKFDKLVEKLSSVIKSGGEKEIASGVILKHLTKFHTAYIDWKSKNTQKKQAESSGLMKDDRYQEFVEYAEQAKVLLDDTTNQVFDDIKQALASSEDLRGALDVLAKLKDFLNGYSASDVEALGVDHTIDSKISTLHELNERLKSSLMRRSEAPISIVGVKSSAKQVLRGYKSDLKKYINKVQPRDGDDIIARRRKIKDALNIFDTHKASDDAKNDYIDLIYALYGVDRKSDTIRPPKHAAQADITHKMLSTSY